MLLWHQFKTGKLIKNKSMKRFIYIALIAISLFSCTPGAQKKTNTSDKPWNVSIYLDLSDRITKGIGETQTLRDTAIISCVIDLFVDNVVKHKIVPCDDKFQVFFYPTDGISNASALSRSLSLNLKDYTQQPAQKKQKLMSMKSDIMNTIVPIYEETLQNKKWLGSDIWGFFKKRINTACVEDDYRNILIILTDGYIYHQNSTIKQNSNEFSYVVSNNISIPNMKLIPCNDNLQNLEVLLLEINPSQQTHYDKLNNIIGSWLTAMGVEHYQIEETDVTANITPAIKQFFK